MTVTIGDYILIWIVLLSACIGLYTIISKICNWLEGISLRSRKIEVTHERVRNIESLVETIEYRTREKK